MAERRFFRASLLRAAAGATGLLLLGLVGIPAEKGPAAPDSGVPAPKASMTPEQLAEWEQFFGLRELSVRLESPPPGVSLKGQTLAGSVGDEVTILLEGIPPSGNGYRIEPFYPAALGEPTPILLRSELKVDPDGMGRITIGLIQGGPNLVLMLRLSDGSGRPLAKVAKVLLQVESRAPAAGPSGQPEKNPPLGALSLPFPLWAAILLGVFVFLVAGGAAYFLMRWSRKQKPEPLPVLKAPDRPEDVEALDALATIERQNWVSQGKHKAHFFGTSEVLKRYIGRRYSFYAAESTTHELLESLRSENKVGQTEWETLRALMERLDWFKFTDAIPSEVEGSESLRSARQWILQTRRVRVPEGKVSA